MPRRWAIVLVAALATGATIAASFAFGGMPTALRNSAKLAFFLFAPVFAAAPLHRLAPSEASKWLLRNRRYLGVSFAIAFLAHGAVIAVYAVTAAKRFPVPVIIGGGLAFALTAAMAATSFDRTAAWIGRRAWRVLHRVGVFYLDVLFTLAYASRFRSPSHWPLIALAVGLVALRIAAHRRAR